MTHLCARAARRVDRVLGDAARAKSGKRHVEEGRLHLACDLVRAWIEIERMNSPRGDGRALERGAERAIGDEEDIHLHRGAARNGRRAFAASARYRQKQEREGVCYGLHNPRYYCAWGRC